MDLVKFEERFKIGGFIIFLATLILIGKNQIGELESKLFQISIAFILLPISILAIYYITRIKSSIQSHYTNFCIQQEKVIKELRKKERLEKNLKKRKEYIVEISNSLDSIADFQNNRLTKNLFISLILIIGAVFSPILNVGQYVNIPTWIVTFPLVYYGLYKSIKALIDIISLI